MLITQKIVVCQHLELNLTVIIYNNLQSHIISYFISHIILTFYDDLTEN